ncbi:MAG: RNA polymerase sigma-70 factor [Bacteroidales bacterium]|jgi:RNA polymerase sigma-70 factor (ECF subfamily)|nr:RNA polymerase sigma-70 factor [Bacteroidales bacterium]
MGISSALLEQFKEGDKKAFEDIYVHHSKKVYRFAKRYMKHHEDAEEIVQEVFIRLWEARESINPEMNFDNYLFTITRNLIFNQHRKKVNESYFQTFVLASFEENENQLLEDEISTQDLSRYIDEIVNKLPPKQQEVFMLSRKQMLTYKEISAQLNISEKTVEAHIYQVLKTIRKYLIRGITFFLFFF